ncbi:MAG: sensor domain-containing diguanylate cyclase [Aliidiomarina sp.]|uniref:sensor domain-containing diguanylate cyclase n=1 Tax=Aliidiomarina sp. TaxID=1872439 RepID=UPI0025C367BC|nr:sensor domain-containing diguanylate cyclase [Aliidiomarina sp.]MCH8500750.1 sensor domain-containing diguanylate cyclase [Aliidiomarina sp.]
MSSTAFAELAEYLDLLLEAICVVEPNHRISYVSRGAERVFGYRPDEMVGRMIYEFMHPDYREASLRQAARVNAGGDVVHFENKYIHKDGHAIDIHWTTRWSEKDQVRVGVARDITEQKRLEVEREALIAKLESMALTDSLTGLPNRVLFADRAEGAITRAQRSQRGFGVLYIDLDKFKQMNDEQGHAFGDEVLKAVGQRLQHSVRPTDTIARLGGDEFVVLVDVGNSQLAPEAAVNTVVKKIDEAFAQPLQVESLPINIGISIGIALWPVHGLTIEQLLQHADHSMYRNKFAK